VLNFPPQSHFLPAVNEVVVNAKQHTASQIKKMSLCTRLKTTYNAHAW